MSEEGEHSRILAVAAREALTPLGFWRKGRSRVWLADRGFWLCVIEFQPSGFSKGSYLNVAAHWLWSAMPESLSFDYMIPRKKPWISFHGDSARFAVLAKGLAEQAASESKDLKARVEDVPALATRLLCDETQYELDGRGGGWPAFNAAMVAGLSGDMANAQKLFMSAFDSIGRWRADLQNLLVPYAEAINHESSFRKFIAKRINEERSRYRLHALDLEQFWLRSGTLH